MMTTNLFALNDDIISVFVRLEASRPLKYALRASPWT